MSYLIKYYELTGYFEHLFYSYLDEKEIDYFLEIFKTNKTTSEIYVRLIENINLSSYGIEKIYNLNINDIRVIWNICKHPNTPEYILEKLCVGNYQHYIAANEKLSKEMIQKLYDQHDYSIDGILLGNINVDKEIKNNIIKNLIKKKIFA